MYLFFINDRLETTVSTDEHPELVQIHLYRTDDGYLLHGEAICLQMETQGVEKLATLVVSLVQLVQSLQTGTKLEAIVQLACRLPLGRRHNLTDAKPFRCVWIHVSAS